MSPSGLIEDTFARIDRQFGDVSSQIFACLFAMEPAFEDLFVMDTDGGVRRNMLITSINCVRGIARGDSNTPRYLIEAARMIHDGFGLSDDQVNLFFVAMRDTYRTLLGTDWQADREAAWEALLAELFETGRS